MFPFIIGVGVGVLIDELFHSEKGKDSSKNDNKYLVFVRSNDFGKSSLTFNDYQSAKKMFDSISSNKKVKYSDIILHDDAEKELFEKWTKEGNIGKKGYPRGKNQFSSVSEVSFGMGDEEFDSKEF